jgi:cyanophycinase-like exopeptidase
VDSYAGTRTYRAFHDVLARGGVIGGSSAGATIQGDYLVRGDSTVVDWERGHHRVEVLLADANHPLGLRVGTASHGGWAMNGLVALPICGAARGFEPYIGGGESPSSKLPE